jgi:hypothetical protein
MRGITRVALPALMAAGLTIMAAGSAFAAVPSNDDFANASVISVTPFTDAVSTVEATNQATDATGCGGGHSVWYVYTATNNGSISFDTFGSSFDTLLSAYTGTEGSLTQVACNDDAGGTLQSQVSFDITSGTTYHFMASGCCRPEEGESGDLVVHADVTGPPFSFEVSFDSGSVDMKTHEVTIDGSVVCSEPGVVDIAGGLQQRNTHGSFAVEVGCSADAATFSGVVSSTDNFQPGKASIDDVTITGCGAGGCVTESETGLVTTVKVHP